LEYGFGEISAISEIINNAKTDQWALNPDTATPEYDFFINRTGLLPNYYAWDGIDDRDKKFKDSAERFQVPADEYFDDTTFDEVARVFGSMQEDRITQKELERSAGTSRPAQGNTTGLAAGPNANALDDDEPLKDEEGDLPPPIDETPKDLGNREKDADTTEAAPKKYLGFRKKTS
jgi:hypothetical protein